MLDCLDGHPSHLLFWLASRGTYYGKQLLPIIRLGSTRSRSVPITTASL
jgi:hypothetical protein